MSIDNNKQLEGRLIADFQDGVPLQKVAAVRPDNLGYIKSTSGFVNNLERMDCLEARLELPKSMSMAQDYKKRIQAEKRDAACSDVASLLNLVLKMFGANDTKTWAFTNNHAKAMLFIVFGLEPPKNAKKGDLLTLLEKETADNPDKIRGAVQAAQVEISDVDDAVAKDAITKVVPDSPMRVVQQAAATEDDGVGAESNVAAEGWASTMASWLYYRCVGAVTMMKSDLSPLELGKIILTTLRNIENHKDYDSDDCKYCQRFGRRNRHPNVDNKNCFWNKTYKGWRLSNVCRRMKLNTTPTSALNRKARVILARTNRGVGQQISVVLCL